MATPRSIRAQIPVATALLLFLTALAVPARAAASTPHDDFADALTVSGETGATTVALEGATFESGEPDAGGSSGWGSVWIRWTAPASGTWAVSSDNAADQRVAIYRGSALGSLTAVPVDYCAASTSTIFTATAGTTYHWQVRGPAWQSAPAAEVGWTPSQPDNDDFADAIPLGGSTSGSLQGQRQVRTCTSTSSEPSEPSLGVGRTVWYSWKAPDTAAIRFNTSYADNLIVAVYRGSQLSGLTRVGATSSATEVRLRATAGTTYRVQVGVAESGLTPASGTLSWIHPVAFNDLLAYAQPLPRAEQHPYARRGTVFTDNVGAGREPEEPVLDVDRSGRSLWWQVRPEVAGRLVLDTSGSQVDTVIGLYRRVGDDLDLVAKADDGGGTWGAARLEARVLGGKATYVVLVDSMGGEDGGIDLRWRLIHPAPRNDDFVEATRLTTASGSARSWTFSASRQSAEPAHGGVATGRTVWWKYVAPRSGQVVVSTSATRAFAAYRGASLGALTRIDEPLTTAWPYSKITFAVVKGRSYKVVVGTDSSHPPSPVSITWVTNPPRPVNDDRADARTITGAKGRLTLSTVGATGEAEQGESSSVASVWFSWRATHSGWETFDTTGSQAGTGLVVHPPGNRYWANLFGSQSSDLSRPTAYPGGSAKVQVRVIEGRTYPVQLWTSVQGANTVSLAWRRGGPPGRPRNDDLSGARVLDPASGGSVSATLRRATYQPGESLLLDECSACGYDQGDHGPSVWFRWTAPADGIVRFDSGPEGEPVWMSLYRSARTVGDLAPVGAPTIGTPGHAYTGTTLDVTVRAGSTYVLRASSPTFGAGFVLRWRLFADGSQPEYPPPPDNDAFAEAQLLASTAHGSVSGNAAWSTLETGEPQAEGIAMRHSVWYQWTAPASGLVTIGVPAWGDFGATDHTVRVWTGSTLEGLSYVPGTYWGDRSQRPTVHVTAGQVYRIQVGADARAFALTWDMRTPANDDLAAADDLGDGRRGAGAGYQLVRATTETGEPAHADGQPAEHTAWLRWTPRSSGSVQFTTSGEGGSPLLDVFASSVTDPGLGDLTRVAAGPYGAEFPAIAGTTYWLRMDAGLASVGGLTWTQRWDLTRPNVGMVLDGGASATGDTWVALRLSGRDDQSGFSGWYVSLAAANGEPLAPAWVPAKSTGGREIRWSVTHTAHGGSRFDGAKTVFVQSVDRQGNRSALTKRTIMLAR